MGRGWNIQGCGTWLCHEDMGHQSNGIFCRGPEEVIGVIHRSVYHGVCPSMVQPDPAITLHYEQIRIKMR